MVPHWQKTGAAPHDQKLLMRGVSEQSVVLRGQHAQSTAVLSSRTGPGLAELSGVTSRTLQEPALPSSLSLRPPRLHHPLKGPLLPRGTLHPGVGQVGVVVTRDRTAKPEREACVHACGPAQGWQFPV